MNRTTHKIEGSNTGRFHKFDRVHWDIVRLCLGSYPVFFQTFDDRELCTLYGLVMQKEGGMTK